MALKGVAAVSAPKSVRVLPRRINRGKEAILSYKKKTRRLAWQTFLDDFVSPEEMQHIRDNHAEIMRDFLCACELQEQMEADRKSYSEDEWAAIHYITDGLMQARRQSYLLVNKATFHNMIPPIERARRQQRILNPVPLNIRFSLYDIFELEGNAQTIIRSARKYEKKHAMTSQEAKRTTKRLKVLINEIIEKGPSEVRIAEFIRDGLKRRTR